VKVREAAMLEKRKSPTPRGYKGGTEAIKGKESQGNRAGKKIFNPLPPRLLSLKNAGIYLGRSTWGMRELYWANKIPWVRDGKKIFFDVRDLDQYIETHKSAFV
jgi:hypothetical protein